MSKKSYIGINNTAHEVKKTYIGIDGVARAVKKVYIGVNGIAEEAWSAAKQVTVIIASGSAPAGSKTDSAKITITSEEPFAPIPSTPEFTTTSFTHDCSSSSAISLSLLPGTVVECKTDVSGNLGGVSLNGTSVGKNYTYIVTRNVTISLKVQVSLGDSYGTITITET